MKTNYKLLTVCLALPLAVGALSAFLTNRMTFDTVNQPALSPPAFLFPIVWTILYLLMGFASYLVITSNASREKIQNALFFYGLQLFFNFFWSIWFFNFGWYLFAFVWLLALWILIFNTIKAFFEVSKTAAYLLLPYLLWVTFAGYLNFAIYLLNSNYSAISIRKSICLWLNGYSK